MSANRRFPWATAIIATTIVTLALVGAALLIYSWNRMGALAGQFKTGHITTTFTEDIPIIVSTRGDVLELATLTATETFTREDSTQLAWGYLPASTTTAEIRVPVTYRYHLRLSDRWRLAARGNVCIVQAPQFKPSLPPAIDTGLMEKRSANGWASLGKNTLLEELEKDITRHATQRAVDAKHLDLVREKCRQSVAEFVKNWLAGKLQWPEKINAIIVVFPDEKAFADDQTLAGYAAQPVLSTNNHEFPAAY